MYRNLFLLILSVFCITQVNAQYTNVLIDDIGDPEEPSIAINPKNSNEQVAGSNIDNVYYSHDAGQTWTKNTLTSQWGVWGDPCIIADTLNNFFFFHLANPPAGSWIDRIICQRSSDAGVTWPVESFTGLNGSKAQDKEWSVFDHCVNSPYKGSMYVTWTEFDQYGNPNPSFQSRIQFSRSLDHGASWSAPQTISQFSGDCIDEDHTAEGAVPCIGPNGEVYVSWGLNDTIYFDKSTDGGNNWLHNDIVAATQPGGWDFAISGIYRCDGMPITACDLSNGSHRGTIYINWSDQRNGTFDTDIWICKSTNGGNTLSAPVRVNNDLPGKQNFLSWMTIDQSTGYIYIVFYDRRNSTGDETEVYVAYSTDGGQTFTNVKVSQTSFTPDANYFFGDYTNIDAVGGIVRPIWMRMDGGATSVYTALMNFTTDVEEIEPYHLNAEMSIFPNPFSATTTIQFNLKEPHQLSMDVFDLTGRMVAGCFASKTFSAGAHSFVFDNAVFHLTGGMYLLNLSDGRLKQTIRLQVVE